MKYYRKRTDDRPGTEAPCHTVTVDLSRVSHDTTSVARARSNSIHLPPGDPRLPIFDHLRPALGRSAPLPHGSRRTAQTPLIGSVGASRPTTRPHRTRPQRVTGTPPSLPAPARAQRANRSPSSGTTDPLPTPLERNGLVGVTLLHPPAGRPTGTTLTTRVQAPEAPAAHAAHAARPATSHGAA